jgi:protein-S-isoprenylcysteine O-methyltransferase Ste14
VFAPTDAKSLFTVRWLLVAARVLNISALMTFSVDTSTAKAKLFLAFYVYHQVIALLKDALFPLSIGKRAMRPIFALATFTSTISQSFLLTLCRVPKPNSDQDKICVISICLIIAYALGTFMMILGRVVLWRAKIKKGDELVTSFPYNLTRNPEFLGEFLSLVVISLSTQHYLSIITFLLNAFIFNFPAIFRRELKLSTLPPYKKYLIPTLSSAITTLDTPKRPT